MTPHPVVLVTTRSFSTGARDVAADLATAGCEVVRGAVDHDLTAIGEPLSRAVAWIAGTSPVTATHLAVAPHLRVVARYGVGVDKVDVNAAAEQGVVVTNTPGANTASVADHTVALLLASLRGVIRGNSAVRRADWRAWRARDLRALTVGLLGFGRIGQATAARLLGFGATVLAADPAIDSGIAAARGVELVPPDALPGGCDAVCLHLPGGQLVVDSQWLSRSQGPLWLINTARADLVDEAALAMRMRTRSDLFYAADTLQQEHGDAPGSPLLADDLADRVIITPHLAANTLEAVDQMGAMVVANVLAVLHGTTPPNPVGTRKP